MEEQSQISSEQLSGEKRKGNGLEEKDELGSKHVKLGDLDSDTNLQSDKDIEIAQKQPSVSKEHMSEKLVSPPPPPDAEVLSKDVKPPTVVGEVSKNNSVAKPRENSESVGNPSGAVESDSLQQEPLLSVPVSEKAASSLGKSDSMRRWMEMKRNGFVSGPLGGVAAPSSVVVPSTTPTPVEIPATQKQQKSRRKGDSVKKRNEVPRKEQQQVVDRFSNVTGPSGLLTELNPGIINHVRSKKQVCSIIEALIRNAADDDDAANLHVRGPVGENLALTFKLPSTAVSDDANPMTNPEQATSLAVEAATVASQWLEFLHQDLSGRLSAVQESKNRVDNVLTTELPLLVSSRESSSLQMTNTIITSGDASSDKAAVTEPAHQLWWSGKFDHFKQTLHNEERDLEHSLNQVKEMQARCNEGLRQMDEYSLFSSQSSDSSSGKDWNPETSTAVQAAAASIFSTCSFLLSMMQASQQPPPPTGS